MRISQAYDLLAANTMTRPETATDPKTATNGHPKTTPDTETAWDELNEPYTGPLYTWPCGHQNTIEWDDYQDEKGRDDGRERIKRLPLVRLVVVVGERMEITARRETAKIIRG